MSSLDLTVFVKPKQVLECKYFIYLPSLVANSHLAVMCKCPDYVQREIEP